MTAPNMWLCTGKPNQDRISSNSLVATHNHNRKWTKWIWVMVIVASILSGALFGIFLTATIHMRNQRQANNELSDDLNMDVISDTTGAIKFISRSAWMAQPPDEDQTPLKLPSTRVIIAHTATKNCSTLAACNLIVRSIQAYHVESLRMNDIAYNFLIGGNGDIYIGRGWDIESNHTYRYNNNSIGIALIGTFTVNAPPPRQLYATQYLMSESVSLKKLNKNYKLYGHRQLKPTESPGIKTFEVIKTWAHWTTGVE